MDSYVHKLPNMAIPNPGLTDEESALLSSILDFLTGLQEAGTVLRLNAVRQKIAALPTEKKV
jgi:hypothetical protein